VYAAWVGGKRLSEDGLASLSLKAAVLDFFFLCRRSKRMKIPISARAATPPTTTPAMSAVEGPLDLEDDAAAADVEEAGSCEVEPDALLLVEEARDDVGWVLLAVRDAAADVIAAAIEVGLAGVGKPLTTLPATDSMIEVGTETPLSDKTEVTSPTRLDRRSPICLRW
jgi:hypothetical protein